MPLTPGSTFERYEIQTLIGRGGMGEVYRAIDSRLHRQVALKVLRTDADASATVADAGGVQRLLREARAAAALNHANSVAIYELGEAEGIAYIAMELVTGMTLRHYLGPGKVSNDTKVTWLVDAARALWAAHKAGLVHRDVKPGNIMVSEEGVVKVLDFGLAKPIEAKKKDPAGFETLMGQVLGTPRYMAPEQLEGKPADALADQFAFGITAYELVSGVYPGGPLAGAAPSLDTVVANVSPELAHAVGRMMARNPADRFPNMEAAAHALRACTSSVPQVAAAPVSGLKSSGGASAARPSDHPTVVQPAQNEPASASREIPVHVEGVIEKSKTLPLAMPLKMAIGERTAGQLHASASPSSNPMNKTMPLGAPLSQELSQRLAQASAAQQQRREPASQPRSPSNPQLNAGLTPTSGVFPSNAQAAAARMSGSETTSRSELASAPAHAAPSASPLSRASRSWIALLIVAIVAIAAGGVAAWQFR